MTLVFRVTGMHCEGCAAGIERYLRSTPGVDDATVDPERDRATVEASGGVDVSELVDDIEAMGYEVERLDG